MAIKIFNCHHERPAIGPVGDLFTSLWTGGPPDEAGNWLTDLVGLNIAPMVDLGDMRHQFYVWKNLTDGLDYIGFEQYRRLFILDPLAAWECEARSPRVFETRRKIANDTTLWRADVDADTFVDYVRLRSSFGADKIHEIEKWIQSFDIIVPRRLTYAAVDAQWAMCNLSLDDWRVFVNAIEAASYFRKVTNYIQYNQIGGLFCNMYIMRTHLFHEYMSFWSEVIFSIQNSVDRSIRSLAFLSERLYSYWVLQKQIENPCLKVVEIPYMIPTEYAGIPERISTFS
ncbi:DUF4422 domain-containing protein [Methylobacterium fujisawaense]